MILADKIIRLRKKNGWSQEELAEKMKVSRQAVSKWESAQSVPDLEKLLTLGRLFGVTMDYLLKDEIEAEEFTEAADESEMPVRRVTLQQANEFLEWRKLASGRIALGVFLCVIAAIPLMILGALAECGSFPISEKFAAGAGLITLLVLVAAAVAIFLFCGFRNQPFEFLDKELFETEYGVDGMVKERQSAFKSTYMKVNVLGVCICVLSPIPIFIGVFTENGFFIELMVTVTMLLAGIGAALFILVGVRWASMQKLLQTGEFAPQEKQRSKITEPVAAVYWLTATAIYLGWSFWTDGWRTTWIIWPVAGVLFAVVMLVCGFLIDRKKQIH